MDNQYVRAGISGGITFLVQPYVFPTFPGFRLPMIEVSPQLSTGLAVSGSNALSALLIDNVDAYSNIVGKVGDQFDDYVSDAIVGGLIGYFLGNQQAGNAVRFAAMAAGSSFLTDQAASMLA